MTNQIKIPIIFSRTQINYLAGPPGATGATGAQGDHPFSDLYASGVMKVKYSS
jgi:hypothetical protein